MAAFELFWISDYFPDIRWIACKFKSNSTLKNCMEYMMCNKSEALIFQLASLKSRRSKIHFFRTIQLRKKKSWIHWDWTLSKIVYGKMIRLVCVEFIVTPNVLLHVIWNKWIKPNTKKMVKKSYERNGHREKVARSRARSFAVVRICFHQNRRSKCNDLA